MRFVVFLAVAAAACGTRSAPSVQSYAEAMKIVCDGAGKDAAYFRSHLTNVEVIRMIESIGDINPAERAKRLHDAIAKAGLTSCPYFDGIPGAAAIPMPIVPDVGLASLGEDPALTITPTGITVEGMTIVAVRNGDVDPADKEGGTMGRKISRLAQFLKTLVEVAAKAKPGGPPTTLNLIVDPTTPYKLLIDVMFTAKSAPVRTFALVVRAGKATKAIPIVLPDSTALDQSNAAIQLVVSITKAHVVLWSFSGQEGSLSQPKLDLPLGRAGDVQKALTEIAERRWPGGKDRETAIVVMADGPVPMQEVAEVMAAVRTTSDGRPLFTDLRLGTGFE
jgi:biopolymer transport protein ExbD